MARRGADRRVRFRALVLAGALVAAACAGAPAAVPAPDAPAPEAVEEFEALYRARVDSARMRFTEADARFASGMIGHHAQALAMAALAAAHASDPSVRTLAARIDNAQRDEIRRLQQWLRDRGRPAPEVMVHGAEVMVHGGEPHAHDRMPGMLTAGQMAELSAARGAAFDRLFLAYMIQHHRGAVAMVDELFATDDAAQGDEIFKLASDVHVDQTTEIARMQSMLAALGGR